MVPGHFGTRTSPSWLGSNQGWDLLWIMFVSNETLLHFTSVDAQKLTSYLLHPRRWSGHYLAQKIPTTSWRETGRHCKGDVWKRVADTPAQVSVGPLVQVVMTQCPKTVLCLALQVDACWGEIPLLKWILINCKVTCSNLSYGGCC